MRAAKRSELPPARIVAIPRLSFADPSLLAIEDRVGLGADGQVREYVDQVLRQENGAQPGKACWISTTDPQELCIQAATGDTALVNLARINDLRRTNQFLRLANACLPYRGLYVCRLETLGQRWNRVRETNYRSVAFLLHLLTFVLHRVFPKLPVTKRIYFRITGGKGRVLSEAEVLGRLICCGFAIVETREIAGELYIVARKVAVTAPAVKPSYELLFRAARIGQEGRKIRVFKLRTMHPYSEYLQEYICERNKLAENGKFKDDFRVTGWGRICRRYWIDELPMLLNWLKGDLKLVGVRPLSPHYASLYPAGLHARRHRNKPGLIPPFYADLPRTFEEILASEEAYLERYERQPLRTDLRYFCRAMYNILFRHVRSA
jgi:lipopolysaccharide/colanic/teichoic acid biosynthesis glycosyltransferase